MLYLYLTIPCINIICKSSIFSKQVYVNYLTKRPISLIIYYQSPKHPDRKGDIKKRVFKNCLISIFGNVKIKKSKFKSTISSRLDDKFKSVFRILIASLDQWVCLA